MWRSNIYRGHGKGPKADVCETAIERIEWWRTMGNILGQARKVLSEGTLSLPKQLFKRHYQTVNACSEHQRAHRITRDVAQFLYLTRAVGPKQGLGSAYHWSGPNNLDGRVDRFLSNLQSERMLRNQFRLIDAFIN